jgi:DNA-binding LytR/AlgR family response regulator
MHELEEKLPHAHFMRIHKSFIVPIRKITSFTAFSVYIRKQEIPVGRSNKGAVSKVLAE